MERNGPCSLEAVCPDPRNAVEDTRELPEVSQDEYGEEDHGPAPAGRVQPPGQRAGPDASAAPLHGALSPSKAHDPERAGRKTLHDVTSVQQGVWKCSSKYNDREIF